jgi:hypothetical protein
MFEIARPLLEGSVFTLMFKVKQNVYHKVNVALELRAMRVQEVQLSVFDMAKQLMVHYPISLNQITKLYLPK